ncbi:hypothetical protein Ssi03_41600 [Sphaerisporangium siamense]|nr:hypothetical protein Ssi03_41600 [Sphaerisporangium siamense]
MPAAFRRYEWLVFLIFLHSITIPIRTIAFPDTLSLKLSIANSILLLAIAVGRIMFTVSPDTGMLKIFFALAVTTSWLPLWGTFSVIEVEPVKPPSVVTPSSPTPTPVLDSSPAPRSS